MAKLCLFLVNERENLEVMYKKYIKRFIDISLSLAGMILASWLYLIIIVAIKIDDPGPVFFTQKRVGKGKTYFQLVKFRTMKMSTPRDIPTHLLEDPEKYITRTGKFLRKTSLDEIPQLWNILKGEMSVIGPRPALWNQDDLIAERDRYGANDIRPGLSGWAQICGRDELEIEDKARLDGEYVRKMSFLFDCRCFFGTAISALRKDGVVEGGTGMLHKQETIGCSESVRIDSMVHRKVLITGAHSYIGESFEKYAKEFYPSNFNIDTIDMIDGTWKKIDFSDYDAVFHVAGIAHADVGRVSEEIKKKYYAVNTDLAIDVAKKSKADGVRQFVFMSSMIVYGESAGYGQSRIITRNTRPAPANFYGDSKWQADKGIRMLADTNFNVTVLRPPMIYGKGSKGNYPILASLAKKLPIFPNVNNKRSMLHIDNLCEFLCQIMLVGKGGIYMPQNAEYVQTSEMVKEIAEVSGDKIRIFSILNPAVFLASKMPGKIGQMVNKAFGSMVYEKEMSEYPGISYRVADLKESIIRTEGREKKPRALILASVASMIDQFNMQNIRLLLDYGYSVDVVCNCKNGNTISHERVEDLIRRLEEKGVSVIHVPIPRKITDITGIAVSMRQVRRMCIEKKYALIHCHSPIGSVVARIAGRKARKKYKTRVIYTAHGFHFYKGAPRRNWMIFYPIEKFCSRFTDVLITINKEDYNFARKHMKAGRIEYIPGIGVDTEKFQLRNFDKKKKREELGVADDDVMVLSVGELNQNKNQEVVIKAIAGLKNPKIHYFIAGKGNQKSYLTELASDLGVNLHLLGYRTDIIELLNTADFFAFPSFREGLSVALMEAMAAGLPCVASEIRGNVDLIDQEGGYLCRPDDVGGFAKGIKILSCNPEKRENFGRHNQTVMKAFDIHKVMEMISGIYSIGTESILRKY